MLLDLRLIKLIQMARNAHKIWNIWKRYFWFKINIWCIYSANKSVVCVSFIIFLSCFCYAFVCVSLLMPCGNLLKKSWSLGFCYDALLWSFHFPIGIFGQVWFLIVSIPDLCPLSYFGNMKHSYVQESFSKGQLQISLLLTEITLEPIE